MFIPQQVASMPTVSHFLVRTHKKKLKKSTEKVNDTDTQEVDGQLNTAGRIQTESKDLDKITDLSKSCFGPQHSEFIHA